MKIIYKVYDKLVNEDKTLSNIAKMVKFCGETLPLASFFIAFKLYDIILATQSLIIVTIIFLLLTYLLEKKIATMPLVSAGFLTFFGGLTIFSNNEIFIKMKPTLVNLVFAMILIIGYLKDKAFLKYLLSSAIVMSDKAWKIFSLRWGLFFIGLALVNEIIWRSFSTDFWVSFKVFGMLPITLVFMATQMPFLMKNIQK